MGGGGRGREGKGRVEEGGERHEGRERYVQKHNSRRPWEPIRRLGWRVVWACWLTPKDSQRDLASYIPGLL